MTDNLEALVKNYMEIMQRASSRYSFDKYIMSFYSAVRELKKDDNVLALSYLAKYKQLEHWKRRNGYNVYSIL